MKRIFFFLLLLASPLPAGAASFDVTINGNGFSPSSVTITAGDTVRWTNTDAGVTHSVFSNPHPIHDAYPPLNLGNFNQGQSVSLAFSTAGTYGYHDHNFSNLTGSVTVQAAPAGEGGSSQPASASLIRPNGGEILDAETFYDIFWQAGGTGLTGIRLSLSLNGGSTYSVIADNEFHDGVYSWKVTNTPSSTARFKVDALGGGGTVLASDASDGDVMIRGTPAPAPEPAPEPAPTEPAPTEPTPPPASTAPEDTTVTGTYSAGAATAANPTIDDDKELPPFPADQMPPCIAGSLLKASLPAVYYCGQNGKRYYFPNESVYRTWYVDFKNVRVVSDAALAAIPFGGTVTYRPGVKMIKIQTDPKTYAVARGGTLRWITSEAKALDLYGLRWNRNIDTVEDSFFATYRVGEPIQ